MTEDDGDDGCAGGCDGEDVCEGDDEDREGGCDAGCGCDEGAVAARVGPDYERTTCGPARVGEASGRVGLISTHDGESA
ncbi:MAG: hypothetical protein HY827_09000 [Actinobacteria bacterium]|nr:hypothetical protein [Actinomycetota bacterium]